MKWVKDRLWRVAVVACVKVWSQHVPGETEGTHETLFESIQSLDWDLSLELTEHSSSHNHYVMTSEMYCFIFH